MDGMLESSYWYGKEFRGPEEVFPLIHEMPIWVRAAVNPALLLINLTANLPFRDSILPIFFPVMLPFVRTSKPRARLRTVEFRGRTHAAMVHDVKPIIDVFAVLYDDTIMGWVDMKGLVPPYFFKLHRDA